MKSFYEKRRDDVSSLVIQRNTKNAYPAHFHNNLEVCLIRNGVYDVGVNGKSYRVERGGILVIDSFDIHSYAEQPFAGERDTCVLIIPHRYLDRFHAIKKGMQIAEPLIRDEGLCNSMLRIIDDYLLPSASERVKQAAVELLLAMLGEHLVLAKSKGGDERVLMRDILVYIQNNFKKGIGRADIARALGYTEAHISRVFHRYFSTTISEYMNGLRLSYMDTLRAEGDRRSVNELIFEAGFGSQQTYYRVRKKTK